MRPYGARHRTFKDETNGPTKERRLDVLRDTSMEEIADIISRDPCRDGTCEECYGSPIDPLDTLK